MESQLKAQGQYTSFIYDINIDDLGSGTQCINMFLTDMYT